MKIHTVKEIRELSKQVTLEDGTKQTVYPGDLTGYLVNGSIHVPLDSNNRLYKKIQKSDIEIEPAYTEEELLSKVKKDLISKIQSLSDTKTNELKNYVVSKKITTEQIDRYERKYQLAVKCKENNDFTLLELEASLQGLTGSDLANLIIQKHDEWTTELENNMVKIEAYRIKAQNLVGSIVDLDTLSKANVLLEKAKQFDVNTTDDEIKTLFKEFE